jgi:tetrapyrrole methylase family protein / MazG family protein
MKSMKEFDDLWATNESLHGPNGCPWDQAQTMNSSRSFIVEESSELVDAIDLGNSDHIREELGDFLFVGLFLCKLAERENRCTLKEVLNEVNEKLIRRHPHVFGEKKINSSDEVVKQWAEIKSLEKGKTHRKSILDSIPKSLPALARGQKVYKKLQKAGFKGIQDASHSETFTDEDSLGKALLVMIGKAQEKGLDAEHALRKTLTSIEGSFREFENQQEKE